jgi:hypothetical protein
MTKDTAMGKPRAHNDEETNGTIFKYSNIQIFKYSSIGYI